jgi:hypothetical protein
MADAIEAIYQKARIDSVNRKRMHAYFALVRLQNLVPGSGKAQEVWV